MVECRPQGERRARVGGPGVAAGSRSFGQLVQLAVDAAGTPHLAYTEITGHGPLSGEVVYVTADG